MTSHSHTTVITLTPSHLTSHIIMLSTIIEEISASDDMADGTIAHCW